jgi:nicotinamidase-related amidase
MSIYPDNQTAILLVDPYKDFLSSRGQAWPLLRTVAKQVNLIENLKNLIKTGRDQGLPIFYAMHLKYRPGNYDDLKYLSPSQAGIKFAKTFKADSFGSEFHPDFVPESEDVIASEHACTSGFGDTDLHEKLQEKGISHLIIVGLLSNTCIESTARSAVDLNYHVTLVTDAVASWTPKDHQAAVEFSYPHIGHIVTTTEKLIRTLAQESKYA